MSSYLSRCDLCSFICFPSSSCPLQVCYSGILPLPFPFGSLCMVWDESWLFDHTYRESVGAVIWYEAPKPVKWARAAVQTSAVHCDSSILGAFYCLIAKPCLWFMNQNLCFLFFGRPNTLYYSALRFTFSHQQLQFWRCIWFHCGKGNQLIVNVLVPLFLSHSLIPSIFPSSLIW